MLRQIYASDNLQQLGVAAKRCMFMEEPANIVTSVLMTHFLSPGFK
jgi:hypothetical protein